MSGSALKNTQTFKTVLITGASSGIGLQLAKDYLQSGWQVLACGRNSQGLAGLSGALPLVFDASNYDDTVKAGQKAAAYLESANLSLDLVILNAGTCEYIDNPQAFDSQLFERVMRTNVIGLGYCLEAFLPLMRRGSRLALMSSSATYLPLPRAEAYGASKAAVSYLAACLNVDLMTQGIGVSVICPGFVKTPLTDVNRFPMPMRVDVNYASRAIRTGLARGKSEIHFPRVFTYFLKLLSLLPVRVLHPLLAKVVAKNVSEDSTQ